MVTTINKSSFLTDVVLFIRDDLKNITDPISSSRPSGESFILTAYPQRAVTYPIITVVDSGISSWDNLGMRSEDSSCYIDVEVRIWARNVAEKDSLTQSIINRLQTNQFSGVAYSDTVKLYDFNIRSVVNVDEPGQQAIKSKVITIRFLLILSS